MEIRYLIVPRFSYESRTPASQLRTNRKKSDTTVIASYYALESVCTGKTSQNNVKPNKISQYILSIYIYPIHTPPTTGIHTPPTYPPTHRVSNANSLSQSSTSKQATSTASHPENYFIGIACPCPCPSPCDICANWSLFVGWRYWQIPQCSSLPQCSGIRGTKQKVKNVRRVTGVTAALWHLGQMTRICSYPWTALEKSWAPKVKKKNIVFGFSLSFEVSALCVLFR